MNLSSHSKAGASSPHSKRFAPSNCLGGSWTQCAHKVRGILSPSDREREKPPADSTQPTTSGCARSVAIPDLHLGYCTLPARRISSE